VIYALVAPVAIGEFEWKDRTRYSDGWHYDPSINEYVQRRDELRAHLGRLNSWDEAATDRQLDQFMEQQRGRLNVRGGPDYIRQGETKRAGRAFPDYSFRNVAQWQLAVVKAFRLVT